MAIKFIETLICVHSSLPLPRIQASFHFVLFFPKETVVAGMKAKTAYKQMMLVAFKNIWVPWEDEGKGEISSVERREKWSRTEGKKEEEVMGEKQAGMPKGWKHPSYTLLKTPLSLGPIKTD